MKKIAKSIQSASCQTVIKDLFRLIVNIPGDKILTLVTEGDVFTVDISRDGKVGYMTDHKPLFLKKLAKAFSASGGLIIREFLSLKQKQTLPNGERVWVPEKNLYGLFLNRWTWRGFSAEEIKESHEIDAQTGHPIPPEEGIHYRDFPAVLSLAPKNSVL